MAIKISNAAAIATCNALVGLIDEGEGDNGTLVIYSGARPADVNSPIDGPTPLVTFALANPAFNGATDVNDSGHATANTIPPTAADATGTASFFRVYDADGDPILDGSATNAAGDGDLKLSSTAIIEAIDVTVVSFTVALPEG